MVGSKGRIVDIEQSSDCLTLAELWITWGKSIKQTMGGISSLMDFLSCNAPESADCFPMSKNVTAYGGLSIAVALEAAGGVSFLVLQKGSLTT